VQIALKQAPCSALLANTVERYHVALMSAAHSIAHSDTVVYTYMLLHIHRSAWDVIHKHHTWTGIVAGSSSVAESSSVTSSGEKVMTSAAAWQSYRHRRLSNAQYALLAMTHVLSLMALQVRAYSCYLQCFQSLTPDSVLQQLHCHIQHIHPICLCQHHCNTRA
jgi:hypothetical protein